MNPQRYQGLIVAFHAQSATVKRSSEGLRLIMPEKFVSALAERARLISLRPKQSIESPALVTHSNSAKQGNKMTDQPKYQNKDGEGAVFMNTRKKNEKQPDWTGTFHWAGQDLELAMWERKSKNGNTPYLKFQVQPKFVPNGQRPQQPVESRPVDAKPAFDDEIPF